MSEQTDYQHLGPRQGSNYRQYFVKGRRIRAEVLYRETVNSEPLTPEEVAYEYDVPVEAVLEAIHYSTHNEDLLREEWEREEANIKAAGRDKWPYAPRDYKPEP